MSYLTTADKKVTLSEEEDLRDAQAQLLQVGPETALRPRDRPSDRGEIEAAYGTRKRIHVEVPPEETRGVWNREKPSTSSGLAELAETVRGNTNRFHHLCEELDCRHETALDAVRIEDVGNAAQEPDAVRSFLCLCIEHGQSALGRDERFE